MTDQPYTYIYPRRLISRSIFRRMARIAFALLSDFQVEGRENIPEEGPLLVVGNHFYYADPVAFIAAFDWPMEFFAGTQRIHAPIITRWMPELWGTFNVLRGTGSRAALKAAEEVLEQKGVLALFPEGVAGETVIRPPRPGTAYLTVRTGAKILPVGIDGLYDIFNDFRRFKRKKVIIRVGEPFGPFEVTGRGRERREQLDQIGDEIMKKIAELLPEDERGYCSDNPALREHALRVANYHF